jgi:parallel beta-helix repeat protein
VPSGTDLREFQRLVDSAAYGDTVLVAPGKYHAVIMRSGIRIIAERGPKETVLSNDRLWVVKADGVDSLASIEGFTLDGIKAAEGVVLCEESKITVRDCIIRGGWGGVRSMFSDLTVQDCKIEDCQNGIYFFESKGRILANEITRCSNGISLVSSSTTVQRNTITGNSVGIAVSKHSEPSIGGSLATANRIYGNPGGFIKNTANVKRSGVRTMKEMTLQVPYNYWGSNCPDSLEFRGPVEYAPWVNEEGTGAISKCPPRAAK